MAWFPVRETRVPPIVADSLAHLFPCPVHWGTWTTMSVAVTDLAVNQGLVKEHSHGYWHS